MATTKGSLKVNTQYRSDLDDYYFHPDGALKLTLNYTVTRSSEKDSTVDIDFSYRCYIDGSSYSNYGFLLTINVSAGNKTKRNIVLSKQYDQKSGSFSLENVTATSSTLKVTVAGTCSAPESGYTCSWPGGDGHRTWTFNIKVPTYDPYDAPTFTLNSYTRIGRLGSTNYNVNYTINKGSDAIEDLDIILLRYQSSWSQIWSTSINRNSSRYI